MPKAFCGTRQLAKKVSCWKLDATLAAHAVLQRLESRPFRLQQGQTGTVEVVALGNDRGFAIRQPPPAVGRVVATEGEVGIQADVLLGNNVLAHVPDLNGFVEGLSILLGPNGVLTMEFLDGLN